MNHQTLTREQWLDECAGLILDEIVAPVATIREEMTLKLSVGYPPNRRTNSKVIGVCFPAAASTGGFNEIFINPEINDSLQVLETLVHEIIHAVDDCRSGHRGEFKRIARAVGLEGKLTATFAGEELRAHLSQYVDLLGHIPHAAIKSGKLKRQVNRNLKVWCLCGFKFNTSRSQIERVLMERDSIDCCACGSAMMFDV